MDKEKQLEIKSKLRIIDDQAKPLAGSYEQYTRLALLGYKTNRDRYLVVFAESQKLFNAVHDALGTPDWIREGFENKWIFIEEVLRRPGATDTIDGYLQALPQAENDVWLATYNYIIELGILASYAKLIQGKTYGLPKDDINQIRNK